MEKILGVVDIPLIGQNIDIFLNTANKKNFCNVFTGLEGTGTVRQITDLQMLKADGTVCFVEISIAIKYHPDKTPKGFSSVLRDVTEHKKKEQALHLSEEMFSKAFRSSPSGMFIAALKGSRIINVNGSVLTSA